jgi:putative SOS response-associated peptidase YedK
MPATVVLRAGQHPPAMCGRFALKTASAAEAARVLGIEPPPGWLEPHYNITPGVAIAILRAGVDGTPGWGRAEWGFRPAWAQAGAPKPINARAESVATSRYFRDAFAHRRCLVPASGWYEWQAADGRKQPWFVSPADGAVPAVLFLAGIWEPAGEDVLCSAILTVPARPPLDRIHDREPLALDPGCLRAWLDPALTDREGVRAAVRRLPESALRAYPVSTEVNRPEHDHEGLLTPLPPEPT